MNQTSPDFSPAASNKLKTGVRVPLYIGIFLLVALFGVGFTWMSYASIAGAIIAPGSVAVFGKPKTVQHLDGGIVKKIYITEGDAVKSEDVLIILDETILQANLDIYSNRLKDSFARRDRLLAERDQKSEISWNYKAVSALGLTIDTAILSDQNSLFASRQASKQGQIRRLEKQIEQLQSQKLGLIPLIGTRERQLNLLHPEHRNIQNLFRDGLSLSSEVINLEREILELSGSLAENRSELKQVAESIEQTLIEIDQVDREFNESVLTDLTQLEREIEDLIQQYNSTRVQLERTVIRSPVDGIVHEMSIFTNGGVVTAGAAILSIVPVNERMEIETRIEPQFIDEIYPDQKAVVRFTAFNQRTTPELDGRISHISPDAIVEEQTGASYYKVQVGVSPEELDRLGGQKLIPGMPVEAHIRTKDRTPMNYLLKPLLDQFQRAFREE